MSTGSFPLESSRRKVIIVLEQHEIERCAYEPEAGHMLIDSEAYVLEFPIHEKSKMPLALKKIYNANLARPGIILVQSPFSPDAYEELSVAPRMFALAKHMYFSMLCKHLGAKEVKVEQVDINMHTDKGSLKIEGGHPVVTAGLDITKEELETFNSQMSLRDEFDGGPPEETEAKQLLLDTGLWNDPNMRTLFEMRCSGKNQIKSRDLMLSLSNEAKTNLNVVARLNVPSYFKLSVDYDRIVRDQYEYKLKVSVKF